MNKTKTIRVSQDTYEQLIAYKAQIEIENRQTVSFDETIDLLLGEIAGLEYELASERLRQSN
ncbi:hypothetical protein [Roseovarius aestuarii]|uniref:Uncharacterized protein n=1 Tax=Roseovarius aestuarii TaxID=475083 RepID=A0A1X7BQF8_9RHOB|nr:hypothetical protein [Roseovarius aestuarii]SMC11820.1 hypothetical protein ROA7745_01639 [Roseovarius aestuarii]